MEQDIRRSVELDDIDQTIVAALRADGRMSIPQLAERVGVSRATAYTRFDRLVDAGVIQGFTARVDPHALGLDVAALVTVTVDQVAWADLHQRVLATHGVQWVGLAAGSYDFVVLVRAASLPELRDVILRDLLDIPGIRSTQTAVLLDEARGADAIL